MSLTKGSVTAVIPTRGDVPIDRLASHLQCYWEIGLVLFVVGDTPFNRYRTMLESKGEIFVTQDDDCVTDLQPLFNGYDRSLITNAMTPEHAAQYTGAQTLIGFGAVFHVDLVRRAFEELRWERDSVFYRESDRIFPTVNPHKTMFPFIEILSHANAPNRLWKQPDHIPARNEINRRILEATGIRA